jgi:malate dehydrogenase (oxaloacetate-decarboxylating)
MFGVIYTPTEGEAIQHYSGLFRKPEGCFLNIRDQDRIEDELKRFTEYGTNENIDYIVVTDGEEVFILFLTRNGGILTGRYRFWELEIRVLDQCLFRLPSLS